MNRSTMKSLIAKHKTLGIAISYDTKDYEFFTYGLATNNLI